MQATWTTISGILSAIVLIGGATAVVARWIKAAKAPTVSRDQEIDQLKADMQDLRRQLDKKYQDVLEKLTNDQRRLDKIDESNRVTQIAILALLKHGQDGNNMDSLKKAEEALTNFLVNN